MEGEYLTLLLGSAARSPFRLERLRRAVAEVLPEVTLIEARHVYIACAQGPLGTADSARLRALQGDPVEEHPQEGLPGLLLTAHPTAQAAALIIGYCQGGRLIPRRATP